MLIDGVCMVVIEIRCEAGIMLIGDVFVLIGFNCVVGVLSIEACVDVDSGFDELGVICTVLTTGVVGGRGTDCGFIGLATCSKLL